MAKAGIDISMIGDKGLERAFKRLPVALQKKGVRRAFTRAARPILKAVRSRVPGSGERHKALRSGIKSRAGRRTRRGIIRRWILLPTRAELGIPADAKHYWPAALEYGHIAGGGTFVAPRSYLRTGFDATEKLAEAIIRKELGDFVAAEWRK